VSFFERGDQALYRAKDAGKNRSFVADNHAVA
jgi:PleD family two-component response regulator